MTAGRAAVAAGAVLYAVVVLAPLLALVGSTVSFVRHDPSAAAALVLPTGPRLTLLAGSSAFAGAVAGASGALGLGVAAALWRRGRFRWTKWLLVALAPIPAYLHAMAWLTLGHRVTLGLAAAGLPAVGPFPPVVTAWWIQVMSFLPLTAGLAWVALSTVPADVVDVARTAGPDGRAMRRILLPLTMPLVLSGVALVFVLTLLDFSVPTLLQVHGYALAILKDFSTRHDPGRTVLYSVPLLVVAGLAGLGVVAGWRRTPFGSAGSQDATPLSFGLVGRTVQAIAAVALTAQIVVPAIALAAAAGTPRRVIAASQGAAAEIGYSVAVAVAAAIIAVCAAAAPASSLAFSRRAGALWWPAVVLPWAVPAALVGIGLITLWNRPAFGYLHGSAVMPALAGAARFTAVAALVLLADNRRANPALMEAARVHARRAWQPWLRVRLPLAVPALAAAGALVFALTLGEIGATLLVAAPGRGTLAMRIYDYLHYGSSDAVASLGVVLAGAAVLAGGLAAVALAAGSRWLSGSRS